ncbi:Receptor protein kinase FERONIA [Spatholobus suberectus]|nr:Receptor protein kinase FERONIA [Spatholobus suberectus]
MDTTGTRIALGTILLLLRLLCFPYHSIAHVIYRPYDLFTINCGRVLTPQLVSLTSQSQFTYSFPVTASPKFLRLFFYSTSYQNFDRSKAYFSVKAGPYTLLQDFNASLNADADDDPGHPNILFREYCINLEDGERLNITFIPSTTDSYAFINGIEIVSMPPYLHYTYPDIDNVELPQLVGLMARYPIESNTALEAKYRLRVGEAAIPASEDTNLLRTWDADNKYVTTQSELSPDIKRITKLSFCKIPNYTAPDEVYRSLRNMGRNVSMNMGFNLTWQLPVDSGFTYMLRLHFCQLDQQVDRPELFVVGMGGFGNVYKGYIDNGSTTVAIKRLKPGSRQGMHELVNEIEMLSQLRHLILVSSSVIVTKATR